MQCRPPNYRGGSRVRSRSGCPLFFFALQFDGGYFAAAFTLDRIQDNMTHLAAGNPAPEFSLKSLDQKEYSLGALLERGPVVAAFFKISCPVCQRSEEHTSELQSLTNIVC